MTQVRPQIDEDLAAEVQAYADSLGISLTAAVRILLRTALITAPSPWKRDTTIKGDGSNE